MKNCYLQCVVCGGVARRRDAVSANDQSVGTETRVEGQQLSGTVFLCAETCTVS